MSNRVYFRGNRFDANRIARGLVEMLTGRRPDNQNIARGVFLSIGFAVLSSVKDSFITKARGGTGPEGVKWPPLKPETIARRRVGPKDRKDNPDIRQREAFVKRQMKKLLPRYLLSMSEEQARATAKRVAESMATRATGKTTVDVFGGRDVEILRDTGILFNSLGPGQLSSHGPYATYTKPTGDGGDEQVFETLANGAIVGTNVLYAGTHQYGDPSRNIPARPFLPDPDHIPDEWEQDWLDSANDSLLAGAMLAYGG